jgi:cell wall-associated NlpC family hydrolase
MVTGVGNRINPEGPGWLKIWPGIIAVAVLFFMASCAHQPDAGGDDWQRTHRAPVPGHDSASSEIQKQLEAEYQRWRGTRHRLGGSSRSGIDCSGFVKAVYKNVFAMDLPRTTKAQAALGRPIKKADLKAGDLVFFKPPSYPRHVGIYMSNSEFVHASKTKGVTISKMDPYYWDKYFWTARRLLTE